MRLLALSIALLSVSLYGAEKSLNGLEGFAKTALTKAQIEKQLEELKKDGLEGFSKDELNATNFKGGVFVLDYSKAKLELFRPTDQLKTFWENKTHRIKDFDAKAIKDQVELRLRQSKLNLANTSEYLRVDALPIMTVAHTLYVYSASIEAIRKVSFEANGKTYFKYVTVWHSDRFQTPKPFLKEHINKLMDQFFKDYYKANPKKKEKE